MAPSDPSQVGGGSGIAAAGDELPPLAKATTTTKSSKSGTKALPLLLVLVVLATTVGVTIVSFTPPAWAPDAAIAIAREVERRRRGMRSS
jgi:hypothetical protein